MKETIKTQSSLAHMTAILLVLIGTGTALFAQNRPIQLTLKGAWASPSESIRTVQVVGSYAYVVVGETGFQVLDVNSHTNPVPLGRYNAAQRINGFHVNEDYAYLAEGSFNTGTNDPGMMEILDVSQPANLLHLGTIDTQGRANVVRFADDHAYVAESTHWTGSHLVSAVEIFSITNPSSPTLVGRYETSNAVHDVKVAGHYAYLAGGDADFTVLDVSHPDAIEWVAGKTWTGVDPHFGEPGGPAYQITLSSNLAYVADGYDGLHILDVSDPHQPVQLFSDHIFAALVGVQVTDRYLVQHILVPGESHPSSYLLFADFRDSSSLVGLGGIGPGAIFIIINDFQVVDSFLYLGASNAGLLVLEITELPFFESVQRQANTIVLSWLDLPGVRLQSAPLLSNPDWTDVPGSLGTNRIELPRDGDTGFFRLIQP